MEANYFTILYWFCRTSTWIRHGCTRVPHPEPPSHIPSHTIPLVHPSAPALSILYPALKLDWRFISYMILYMFQCHSPKYPTLFLSHRVRKTVLYICVSFAVSHTGYHYHLSKFHIYALLYCIWCYSFWLTSLCKISSNFIHLIRTDSNVFFLMAE